jgi:hypothetical protein
MFAAATDDRATFYREFSGELDMKTMYQQKAAWRRE